MPRTRLALPGNRRLSPHCPPESTHDCLLAHEPRLALAGLAVRSRLGSLAAPGNERRPAQVHARPANPRAEAADRRTRRGPGFASAAGGAVRIRPGDAGRALPRNAGRAVGGRPLRVRRQRRRRRARRHPGTFAPVSLFAVAHPGHAAARCRVPPRPARPAPAGPRVARRDPGRTAAARRPDAGNAEARRILAAGQCAAAAPRRLVRPRRARSAAGGANRGRGLRPHRAAGRLRCGAGGLCRGPRRHRGAAVTDRARRVFGRDRRPHRARGTVDRHRRQHRPGAAAVAGLPQLAHSPARRVAAGQRRSRRPRRGGPAVPVRARHHRRLRLHPDRRGAGLPDPFLQPPARRAVALGQRAEAVADAGDRRGRHLHRLPDLPVLRGRWPAAAGGLHHRWPRGACYRH
jgi:hypothetical protein